MSSLSICLALGSLPVLLLGILFLMPSDLRKSIRHKCEDSRGRLRVRFIFKQVAACLGLFSEVALWAAIAAALILVMLVQADKRFDLASLDGQFHQESVSAMTAAASQPPLTAEVPKYRSGSTRHVVHSALQTLGRFFPLCFVLCFFAILLPLRISSRSFNRRLFGLGHGDDNHNLARTRRRYLHNTAQGR